MKIKKVNMIMESKILIKNQCLKHSKKIFPLNGTLNLNQITPEMNTNFPHGNWPYRGEPNLHGIEFILHGN